MEMNYKKIVERMAEEAGVKNLRQLDREIDMPESYAYAMQERGVSKGYLEKYLRKYPKADLNYIFTGDRSQTPNDPKQALLTIVRQLSGSDKLTKEVESRYDDATSEAKENLSREKYLEETLRLVLRLLSIALEDSS